MAYSFYEDCFQVDGLVECGHLINMCEAEEDDFPSLCSANSTDFSKFSVDPFFCYYSNGNEVFYILGVVYLNG